LAWFAAKQVEYVVRLNESLADEMHMWSVCVYQYVSEDNAGPFLHTFTRGDFV